MHTSYFFFIDAIRHCSWYILVFTLNQNFLSILIVFKSKFIKISLKKNTTCFKMSGITYTTSKQHHSFNTIYAVCLQKLKDKIIIINGCGTSVPQS